MKALIHKEEEAIRAMSDSLGKMFNEPTIEFFEKTFTKDCDYITFQGVHLKGIYENFEAHKKLSTLWIFKGATLQSDIVSIRFLRDDIAIMIAKGGIKFRFQKRLSKNRLSINSYMVVKEDGMWKISSFQNTRIRIRNFLSWFFK